MVDLNDQKPHIDYPCQWAFKIIGTDEDSMRAAVKDCLAESLNEGTGERPYELGFSRASSEGKYVSLVLDIEVQDEKERNALFKALGDRPEVRIII